MFVGWSADGRHIGLIRYYETSTVSHSCVLIAFIQDLKTDKIVWDDQTGWGENNETGEDTCPKSFEGGWRKIGKRLERGFHQRHIERSPTTPKVEAGPLQLGSTSIDFTAEKKKDAVSVRAVSKELGKKTLATSLTTTCISWWAAMSKTGSSVRAATAQFQGM